MAIACARGARLQDGLVCASCSRVFVSAPALHRHRAHCCEQMASTLYKPLLAQMSGGVSTAASTAEAARGAGAPGGVFNAAAAMSAAVAPFGLPATPGDAAALASGDANDALAMHPLLAHLAPAYNWPQLLQFAAQSQHAAARATNGANGGGIFGLPPPAFFAATAGATGAATPFDAMLAATAATNFGAHQPSGSLLAPASSADLLAAACRGMLPPASARTTATSTDGSGANVSSPDRTTEASPGSHWFVGARDQSKNVCAPFCSDPQLSPPPPPRKISNNGGSFSAASLLNEHRDAHRSTQSSVIRKTPSAVTAPPKSCPVEPSDGDNERAKSTGGERVAITNDDDEQHAANEQHDSAICTDSETADDEPLLSAGDSATTPPPPPPPPSSTQRSAIVAPTRLSSASPAPPTAMCRPTPRRVTSYDELELAERRSSAAPPRFDETADGRRSSAVDRLMAAAVATSAATFAQPAAIFTGAVNFADLAPLHSSAALISMLQQQHASRAGHLAPEGGGGAYHPLLASAAALHAHQQSAVVAAAAAAAINGNASSSLLASMLAAAPPSSHAPTSSLLMAAPAHRPTVLHGPSGGLLAVAPPPHHHHAVSQSTSLASHLNLAGDYRRAASKQECE